MVFGSLLNSARNIFGGIYDNGRKMYNVASDILFKPAPEGPKVIPTAVRRFLNEHGNEEITSVRIGRTPISSALNKMLNLVSMGGFDRGKQAQNVEEFFHLFLIINEKYLIEKNQLLKIANYKPNDKEESVYVASPNVTIRQLLENGAGADPTSYYGKYEAFGNNCQDFVLRTLAANGMSSPEIIDFVKQPLDKLLPEIGQSTEKTSNFLTDLGAQLDTGLQDLTNGYAAFKKGGLVKKK
jgi:hypothetical protein